MSISTHAPRAGSDLALLLVGGLDLISTHAPRAGSDGPTVEEICWICISTHAPRAGSDSLVFLGQLSMSSPFQPTLPVRGATVITPLPVGEMPQFQPTLPVRGATAIYCVDRVLLSICRPKKSDWPRKTSCKDLKEAECGANLPRDAWEPHVRTADYSAKNPSASYVGFAPTCSIFV